MTVSGSIIRWLEGFEESEIRGVNTDLMEAKVKSYVLIKEPTRNIIPFMSGRKMITDHFTFMARLSSRTDAARIQNTGFGEALSDWIDAQNAAGNFPEVANAQVQSISVTTPFYMGQTQENDSLYQMAVAIQYLKEK